MSIQTVFDPPLENDSPADFTRKAFDLMRALKDFSEELDTLKDDYNGELQTLAEAVETAVETTIPGLLSQIDEAVAQTAAGTATAAKLAAEAARDSSFANAKGAATISSARALVADNETFILHTPGALSFQAYRRTSSTAQVYLGEYPAASAASLTSGDIFSGLSTRCQVFNGGTLVTVSGRNVGFTVPIGQTGGTCYVAADIPATALRGKTVKLIQRYTATAGLLDSVTLVNVFAQYRAGASTSTVTVTDGVRTQTGTEIVQSCSFVVPADADFISQLAMVNNSNTAETSAQTLQVVGVAYQIVSGASQTMTVADIMFAERIAALQVADAAATAAIASANLRIDDNVLTSGNMLGTASVLQANAQVFSGAVVINSGGSPVGFSIPANAGSAGSSYLTSFISAEGLIGKTLDLISVYDVTAGFSGDTLPSTTALQVRTSSGVTNVIVGSGATRTVTQTGTVMTVTTRYTVATGVIDIGVIYQVNAGQATRAYDRSLQIRSVSYAVVPAAGQTKNDAMLDIALAAVRDEVIELADIVSTAVIQAGPTRTYTSPAAANAAVTESTAVSRTEIQLDAGTYTGESNWYLKPYATLRGYGKSRPTIHFELPDGSATNPSTVQPFWIDNHATLENVKVTARNARYAIHAESSNINPDAVVNVRDCWIEHLGNVNAGWVSQAAWGSGISSGWHVRSEGNVYRSPFCAFSYHTNIGYTKPTLVENIGDVLVGTQTGAYSLYNGFSLRLQPLGSGQVDQYRAVGNQFEGDIYYHVDPWLPTTLDYQPADHSEIKMSGYGNSPAVFRINDFGRALRIRAVAGAGSSVVVSGDAVPIIFGEVRSFAGVENLPAYVAGTFDINNVGVGINRNVYITSLGKRLGNCTSVNKTLTVTVGGSPVNIVFDQDYTSVDNATLLASMQSALGPTSTVVVDTFRPGELYRPNWTDEEKSLHNNTAVGIPFGSILAYDGTRKRVRLMTSADPASLFAGVAWQDIYPGQFGRVKTRGWLPLIDIRTSASSLTFGATMSVGATAGVVDAGGTQGLLRAVRSDAVEVAP